jgi:RimJ/RimL family protein N-acetyltransferase
LPRQAGLTPERLKAAPRAFATGRLRLEAPRIEHAPAFFESLNVSRGALNFIAWGREPHDLAWAERFCVRAVELIEQGGYLVFNAFEQNTGAYVGRIDLHSFDFEAPRCEIGYVGDVRVAGQGLMREAVLGVVQFGFGLGLARIQALSETGNHRALRFAEALGFTREGTLRNYERDIEGGLGEQALFATYNPAAS